MYKKYVYKTQIVMLFLIPLWVAIGRAFFGAGGWLLMVTFLYLGPALFVGLLIVLILTRRRSDIKHTRSMPTLDAALLSLTYIGALLYGFFMEDGGDTQDSIGSAASKVFHVGSSALLNTIASLSFYVTALSLGALIVYNMYKLIKK